MTRRNMIPNLEELEARNCLAPVVTWHGGQVLPPGFRIQLVYYGSNWRDPSHLQEAVWLQAAMTDLVQSPYMDELGVYGTGRGNTLPGVLVDSPASALDDVTIQHAMNSFVPPPDTLFLIFTAPGMVSTFGPYSSANYYLGYHYSTGNHERYAVCAYPDKPNTPLEDPTAVNQLTRVGWHEVIEAATDPDVAPTQTGWFADYYFLGVHYTAEVADIVQRLKIIYHNCLIQAVAGIDGQPLYPPDSN